MAMKMLFNQQQEQKLILSQTMKESLSVLQMALPELRDYIQDKALSNPILEVEDTGAQMMFESLPCAVGGEDMYGSPGMFVREPGEFCKSAGMSIRDKDETSGNLHIRSLKHPSDENYSIENYAGPQENFCDYLIEQVHSIKSLGKRQIALCEYLIYCLNERGYMDCEIADISEELRVSYYEVQDAIRIIQSLKPTGVGAGSLKECLVLQLKEKKMLNFMTAEIVENGLQLLSRNNICGLAKMIGCTEDEARSAAAVIKSLEPIPSRGFDNGRRVGYQIPEAEVLIDNDTIVLEMNNRFLPKLSCNKEIIYLLRSTNDKSSGEYLQRNQQEAKHVIRCVEARKATMERVLQSIIRHQTGFFLHGEPLKAMTMAELASELELNRSTVSRTIRDKSIIFKGKEIMLKDFFTNKLVNESGEDISSDSIKKQVQLLVDGEDPKNPLSDEKIRLMLADMHILASRRTVSKYREELGIPCSLVRKQK